MQVGQIDHTISDLMSVRTRNLLKLKKIDPPNPCHRHLPELLDHFEHSRGEYIHTCLAFELFGENLRTFCRRFFPLNKVPSKFRVGQSRCPTT